MRHLAAFLTVLVFAWLQLTFPATLAPWNIVPDLMLLCVMVMCLYYEPSEQALWWSLVAGLLIDMWHPAQFGMWTLASLSVALTTIIIHTRVLPKLTRSGVFVTAVIALTVGLLVLTIGDSVGVSNSFSQVAHYLARIMLPRLILDLLILAPVTWLVRRLSLWLNAYQASKIFKRI
jgi:rod shape-determining protein MreD